MTTDEVPLAIGEVHGYRFWNLTAMGHLASVTHSEFIWQHGVNEAACTRVAAEGEPRAPDKPVPPDEETLFEPRTAPVPANHNLARRARFGEFEPDHPRRLPRAGGGTPVFSEESIRQHPDEETRKMCLEVAWNNYYCQVRNYPVRVAAYEMALELHRARVAAHIAPAEDCNCGFYAVRDPKTASGYATPTSVFGVVQGFGRVVPMEKGWRLGKARILALAPWHHTDMNVLRHKYRFEYYIDPIDCLFADGQRRDYQARRVRLVPYDDVPERDPIAAMRANYPDAIWFATAADLQAYFAPLVAAS